MKKLKRKADNKINELFFIYFNLFKNYRAYFE